MAVAVVAPMTPAVDAADSVHEQGLWWFLIAIVFDLTVALVCWYG